MEKSTAMSSRYSFKGSNFEVEISGTEHFVFESIQKVTQKLVAMDTAIGPSTHCSSNSGKQVGQTEINIADTMRSFTKESAKIRFLALATLLHKRGQKRLETGDINQAVKDNNLSSFVNTSDCRGRCVREGLVAKDGSKFYVTQKGFETIGIHL